MEQEEFLIRKVLSGEQAAFRKIVDLHKNYVFSIILNIVKDRQEAENIAQETFMAVYSSLKNYRGQGFRSWIGKIAVHKSIDWTRKKKREREGLLSYLQNIESIGQGTEPLLEEKVLKEEEIRKLHALLLQLPSKYRDILEKYFIQSMNYKEIAEVEGISVRTVESRLYRGKKLLREAWKEE
ncbi:RNA polymerase sigma factor, sigma-70 family [Anaerovirgula multivorans]|uniref:RNA polymerase sigma factor, sigma-70 family n=1 Tax=Anaerovirgula multivorans TaxID=312168 RepID=A0A239JVV4_9FIRM|nr:RNA polymerase sigma factor [Anaerovirgula multivorans]SNT09588.1 RNA polymerase sigma factor, sigma-70 family [Anaerovirgula multivorans]